MHVLKQFFFRSPRQGDRSRPGGSGGGVRVRCPPRNHPYRTADGSCNNRKRREWGSSFAPFLRFLPSVYGDTVGAEFRSPSRSRAGNRRLPSPRRISSEVHKESTADTQQFSMLVS